MAGSIMVYDSGYYRSVRASLVPVLPSVLFNHIIKEASTRVSDRKLYVYEVVCSEWPLSDFSSYI